MRFKFVFCSDGMKTIETIKITIVFGVISVNIADNVFIAENAVVYFALRSSSFGIIKE